MQVTNFAPSKQYVTANEPFNLNITIKMGSNESVPDLGFGAWVIPWVYPTGETANHKNLTMMDSLLGAPGEPGPALAVTGSIAKGATRSVTLKDIYFDSLDLFINAAGDGGAARRYPYGVFVEARNDGSADYGAYASYTGYVLTSRLDPVINNVAISDTRVGNPLEHFGSFVYGQSLPRFVADVTLDPLDPSLTARHTLVLEQIDGGQIIQLYKDENNTGIFDLDPLFWNGTVHWVYSVVDSAGNTASTSGSFEVLPYSPPEITTFRVMRYKTLIGDGGEISYVDADDGENVRVTIAANVASVEGLNAWELKIKYNRVGDPPITISPLSGTDGQSIAVIDDRTILTATIPASSDFEFTAELTDFFGSVTRLAMVYKAGGYLNVEKFGVAVGMRSTGTPENPLFETAHPARFYAGAKFFEAPEFVDPAAARDALGVTLGNLGVQTGKSGAISVGANAVKDQTINFPIPFASPPLVIACAEDSSGWGNPNATCAAVRLITPTGFNFRIMNTHSASRSAICHWMAIGVLES